MLIKKRVKSLLLVICLCFIGSNNALASNNHIQGKIKRLIKATEEQYGIPSGLLEAIAFVESGINNHAINVAGKPVIATNNNEALKVITDAQENGIRNIDVGVMQLNYRWHSNAFANIQEMLNPKNNIEYAAKLLIRLKKQHGTWYAAICNYHSSKPDHQRKYSYKVVMKWGQKYA
jgi:soluble lytic murein transglycosylase-like protein